MGEKLGGSGDSLGTMGEDMGDKGEEPGEVCELLMMAESHRNLGTVGE